MKIKKLLMVFLITGSLVSVSGCSSNSSAKEEKKEETTVKTEEKYSLQGTTQGRYLTGGVPPVRFSM